MNGSSGLWEPRASFLKGGRLGRRRPARHPHSPDPNLRCRERHLMPLGLRQRADRRCLPNRYLLSNRLGASHRPSSLGRTREEPRTRSGGRNLQLGPRGSQLRSGHSWAHRRRTPPPAKRRRGDGVRLLGSPRNDTRSVGKRLDQAKGREIIFFAQGVVGRINGDRRNMRSHPINRLAPAEIVRPDDGVDITRTPSGDAMRGSKDGTRANHDPAAELGVEDVIRGGGRVDQRHRQPGS
jgi:hypothetical protein